MKLKCLPSCDVRNFELKPRIFKDGTRHTEATCKVCNRKQFVSRVHALPDFLNIEASTFQEPAPKPKSHFPTFKAQCKKHRGKYHPLH